jgi:hypothetical protein
MKRLLLICVISLLFLSGWGHVLAASLCPNMQDMPGCSMQTENAAISNMEGHEAMEMGDMQMMSSNTESKANALARPFVSCCASRPEVPPAPVFASRGAEQSKQDPSAALQQNLKALAPQLPLFATPVTSRQHAPPVASTPRYVLISAFLI